MMEFSPCCFVKILFWCHKDFFHKLILMEIIKKMNVCFIIEYTIKTLLSYK